MVENRPFLTFLAHAVLIVGAQFLCFPVWMALFASTHGPSALSHSPIALWFGDQAWENYSQLLVGRRPEADGVPIGSMMLSVEVRILTTFDVVVKLGLLNTYAALTGRLIASAKATFLFRKFFLAIPDELAEAARIDRAGPLHFFWDIPRMENSRESLPVWHYIMGTAVLAWKRSPPVICTSTTVG